VKPAAPKHGLARVISKLGICSRTQAAAMIAAGRVTVNGRVQLNAERPTDIHKESLGIDGGAIQAVERVYIALNKPRGLIVSTADERGRDTVYSLLEASKLPWLAPVGRLDKASEGLLLMTNDSVWAAGVTNPNSQLQKTYHVQVAGIPDEVALEQMTVGIDDNGEHLAAINVTLLRTGEKNAWLAVVLDEGRNRHIRRLLDALGYEVLRLVRTTVGSIALDELAKGNWRHLSVAEVKSLGKL
jgi:23S rRNA pseudouridine2605 synthase